MQQDSILVIDCGGQYTQLIVRCVREVGAHCWILPSTEANLANIKDTDTKGIIISGGPRSVAGGAKPIMHPEIIKLGLPMLGICYGMQWLCEALGGKVEVGKGEEFGAAELKIDCDAGIFQGLKKGSGDASALQVWMSHGDSVTGIPDGFRVMAHTKATPMAAVGDTKRNLYGLQFHPEVEHTPNGMQMIKAFVGKICKVSNKWTTDDFVESVTQDIRDKVGDAQVVCALSGGVDSTVAAALVHRAIGSRLHCIFVDNGLMRHEEAQEIERIYVKEMKLSISYCDEGDRFVDALLGVTEPEKKRKIIGAKFIEVFEEQSNKLDGVRFLAQGTLYPDVIESISFYGGPAETIKSHHNVGGLPENMKLDLLEPLRQLFKDEVREVARALGVPKILWGRHPFPGPGLAVRVLGEVTRDRLKILRAADHIFISELREAGLYDKIWQAFAALLPINSVGVQGDKRTYESCCVLRAITSRDGMTARTYDFDPAFLTKVATRIVNEVRGINRVVYDITSKPPATIEWE